jgi:hypothetical protein
MRCSTALLAAAFLIFLAGHAGAEPVTFARHIAPIVFDRCGSCHRPGGPAPFSLLTYPAVRQRAREMAEVTKSRFMPPWRAEPESGEFIGQRRLTDAEISLIRRWVDEGAPEGDPRDLPPQPHWSEGWQLGTPDLIVTIPEPYALQADGTDVFRIFVIPLPTGTTRYVRGMEFRPGNARVVHHANIRLDRTSASRRLDEDDPAPGYEGLMPRSAVYPAGHFFGWTPGQIAPLVPKEFAWTLHAGTDLVVQLHMQPSGKREVVQPSIGLYFGGEAPTRTPAIVRLGDQGIDIPAGEPDYAITDSFVLPVDVELQAVQPHAHHRARVIKGFATLPDGTTRWLIHIKDWDFRWQHVYRYLTPFLLPKGTSVTMEYTYDNSAENPRNPRHPPERVWWGQRSADEMGDLWLQVVTRNGHDLAILNREIGRKMVAEDIVGYETMIRASPGEAELHDDVALLYLELGRPNDAAVHFEASVGLKPQSAAAHFNLGTALTVAGRFEEAIEAYRRALRIRPEYSSAHNNLGNVLVSQGRVEDAIGHFREAVRLDPRNTLAQNNLLWLLAAAPDSRPAPLAR